MKKIPLHSQLFFSILVFLFFMPTTNLKAQQLENEILAIKEKYELAGGTVVLFNKNKINNVVNFGFANLETDNPIKNTTLFRVASISKTITTIAFMQLLEQKKVSLDDNISKILSYEIINPFYHEKYEQYFVHKWLKPDDIVLELGGRYGVVACTIDSILINKKNHVVVEPDKSVINA